MKTFISHAELLRVLELLGLPDDVSSVELRGRDEPMAGLSSSWMLKATRVSSAGTYPFTIETTYVPVMLPLDEDEHRRLRVELESRLERDRQVAQHVHGKKVEHAFLPDVTDDMWRHCENARPHRSHLHDVVQGSLTYRDMFCVGVSEIVEDVTGDREVS